MESSRKSSTALGCSFLASNSNWCLWGTRSAALYHLPQTVSPPLWFPTAAHSGPITSPSPSPPPRSFV